MAASSISSQMGIIASPISVAVVSLTALLLNANYPLAGFDGYIDLLKITIPSTLLGAFPNFKTSILVNHLKLLVII